jgi:hypothetical protein
VRSNCVLSVNNTIAMVWFRQPIWKNKQGLAVSRSWEEGRGPVEIHNHGAEPVVISFDDDVPAVAAGQHAAGRQYAGEQDAGRQPRIHNTDAGQHSGDQCPDLCGLSGSAVAVTSENDDKSYPENCDDIKYNDGKIDNNDISLSTSEPTYTDGISNSRDASLATIHRMRGMNTILDRGEREGKSSTTVTKRRLLVVLLCVLIVILISVTVLTVQRNKRGSSNNVSGGSSNSNADSNSTAGDSNDSSTPIQVDFSEREAMLQGVLTETSVGSLVDESSSQGKAFRWLADEDPAMVALGDYTAREIQERFAMASLFFATSEVGWTNQIIFLSEGSICTWNDGQTLGTFCDDNGTVISVNIGELWVYYITLNIDPVHSRLFVFINISL